MSNQTEIAHQIVHDPRPSGPDGASNVDRLAFICEVFDTETIDLDGEFEFSGINACKDIDTVEACRHLALLKISYLKEMTDHGFKDAHQSDIAITYLTLTVQRINWHLQHLGMGRVTPPFPGLN